MRNDKELLAIQNFLVRRAEGVDFLEDVWGDDCKLTPEEIEYIRALGRELDADEY